MWGSALIVSVSTYIYIICFTALSSRDWSLYVWSLSWKNALTCIAWPICNVSGQEPCPLYFNAQSYKKRFIIPNLKVEALKAKDGKYLSTVTQFVKDKISFLHRLVIPKFISISTSYTKIFLRETYFKRKQSTN